MGIGLYQAVVIYIPNATLEGVEQSKQGKNLPVLDVRLVLSLLPGTGG